MNATLDPGDVQARYALGDEEERWRRRARAFAADVLAPRARAADRARAFDRAVARGLGEAGLLAAALPEEAGGHGASVLADCLIAEEIGAVDGSARGFLAVQIGLVARTIVASGTPAQRARWLPPLLSGEAIGAYALTEPEAGSDVGALTTRVRRDGDEAVLDGEKIWITNGGVADVLVVFAKASPDAGTKGIEAWLVEGDARGLVRQPVEGREFGHRASDHARLLFEDVRVPAANRLGPARGGFAVAMEALGHGRLNVAAGAVGIHRACLEASVAFARHRRQFGRRIGDFQQIGGALADLAAGLEASRLLVHHAARLADRGLENAGTVSAAKLLATEGALRAAATALQIHGSRGYTDALPVERHYRDAIGLTIYEGTSQIQRLILARRLLGKEGAGPDAAPRRTDG